MMDIDRKKTKYVAAGFLVDAGRLLEDFLKENSVEFPVFAAKWRQHKFSLIFMGRPDDYELTVFTNEIFTLTTQYLSSVSFSYQVGALFLMYALFRNQISDPPIRFRIEFCHWEVIDELHQKSIENKYGTLHYCIDYLIENGLTFLAKQTLMGPLISATPKASNASETIATIKASLKNNLEEYTASTVTKEINALYKSYQDVKKKLDKSVKVDRSSNPAIFDNIIGEWSKLLDGVGPSSRKEGQADENIGRRRSNIKNNAFSKRPSDFWGRNLESDDNDDAAGVAFNETVCGKAAFKHKHRRGRGKAKKGGKVGRPRLNHEAPPPEEEVDDPLKDISMNHLLEQQQELYNTPKQVGKGKKISTRHRFYELSPKHHSEDST